MCRRGDKGNRLAALALAFLLAPVAAGAAGVSSPQVTGVEMTPAVRQTLKQIEEQWLQWIVRNNRQEADSVVESLLETAGELGMRRLPDLSAGAVARAVQAARQKDFPRARWALDAAERFDPGRPETAFAEATVDRLQGNWLGASVARLRAYPRMFGPPLERYLWFQDFLVWCLTLLMATGGLFLAVQMLTKGSALFEDVVDLFGRRLPRPAALAAAGLALLWPVFLPHGALWLPLYWSILLWGYASASERVVLIALWLLLGVSPVLARGPEAAGRGGALAPRPGHGEPGGAPALRQPVLRPRRAALAPAAERRRQASAGGRAPLPRPVGRWPARSTGRCWRRSRRTPSGTAEPRRLLLPQGGFRRRHPELPEGGARQIPRTPPRSTT